MTVAAGSGDGVGGDVEDDDARWDFGLKQNGQESKGEQREFQFVVLLPFWQLRSVGHPRSRVSNSK